MQLPSNGTRKIPMPRKSMQLYKSWGHPWLSTGKPIWWRLGIAHDLKKTQVGWCWKIWFLKDSEIFGVICRLGGFLRAVSTSVDQRFALEYQHEFPNISLHCSGIFWINYSDLTSWPHCNHGECIGESSFQWLNFSGWVKYYNLPRLFDSSSWQPILDLRPAPEINLLPATSQHRSGGSRKLEASGVARRSRPRVVPLSEEKGSVCWSKSWNFAQFGLQKDGENMF